MNRPAVWNGSSRTPANGSPGSGLSTATSEQSPRTWENVKDGWVWILDSMKTLLEQGTLTAGCATTKASPEARQILTA